MRQARGTGAIIILVIVVVASVVGTFGYLAFSEREDAASRVNGDVRETSTGLFQVVETLPWQNTSVVGTNSTTSTSTTTPSTTNTTEVADTNTSNNVNAVEGDEQEVITYLDKKYIVSEAEDASFQEVGFFYQPEGEDPVFIYAHYNDDPYGIENFRTRVNGIERGAGKLSFTVERKVALFYASLISLESENRILSPSQLMLLAQQTRLRGNMTTVNVVYYQDVQIDDTVLTFNVNDVTAVDYITETTGGSVYLVTLHFRQGKPLNVWAATKYASSTPDLQSFSDEIIALKNTDEQEFLIASKASYQDTIYTFDGVRTGWTVALVNLQISQ